MRAVKEQRLAVESPAFEKHIDRCLGCRACESACPAGVQYGQLLEAARADLMRVQANPGFIDRMLRFGLKRVWPRPWLLRAGFAMARLLRDLGVVRLLINTGAASSISEQFAFALALLEASRANSSPQISGAA